MCTRSQEEYEDDFEKDLDWLISEEGRSEDQVSLHLLFLHLCLLCSTYCRLGAACIPDLAL